MEKVHKKACAPSPRLLCLSPLMSRHQLWYFQNGFYMAHDVIETQTSKLAITSWSNARSVHEDPYIGRKTLGLIMEGEGARILFT